jgi:N-acyl-D-amino-acid deacylase
MATTRARSAPAVALPIVLLCCALTLSAQQPAYDLIIAGGTVIDGTGQPGFAADIAIVGDRIARVDRTRTSRGRARAVLEAEGLIVAPGFIDHHAHVEYIHQRPLAESLIRQGITTVLMSLHSGPQPWPLARYAHELKVAPNVGFFAGHNWIRRTVMGTDNRAPTAQELVSMKTYVDGSMKDGALGLSTGLRYVPGAYARSEEIIELAGVAASYGGIYVSHVRDEGPGVLESVREVIQIAREAGLPGQVQHHKVMGAAQKGKSVETLALIDAAIAQGLDITLDAYPYTATGTGSSVLFPSWALAGGQEALKRRLGTPADRKRIEAEVAEQILNERGGGDLRNIQFARLPSEPRYTGRTMADLAADRGLPNNLETGVALAIELQMAGGFSGVWHVVAEEDVVRILRHPRTMVCTDGDLTGYGMESPHPRSYGAFPRVLGRYVREQQVLTLPDAIRRMTSLSAAQIGQPERGVLAENKFADVTVFDAATVVDRASFDDPHQYPQGIHHVVVNGTVVMRDGSLTGERPGRPLLGPPRPRARRASLMEYAAWSTRAFFHVPGRVSAPASLIGY